MIATKYKIDGERGHIRSVSSRRFLQTGMLCLLFAILSSPVLSILIVASGNTGGLFVHLLDTVLPRYMLNTILLMCGVGIIAGIIGVSAAWVVCRYEFWGRQIFDFLLVLPAAIPAYIIAYAYTDFLEYSGPVQTGLRALFRWDNAQDYWFFEIRSLGGAMVMMGLVLYPYVYLMVRTALRQTSSGFFEVGMLSGRAVFGTIALPLVRPAIAAGLAVVLMEVISDFGTVDYFAVETLTLGIFNVWIGMGSIEAASQLALFAFLLIGLLISVEMFARRRGGVSNASSGRLGVPRIAPSALINCLCVLICALPIGFGFIVPALVLVSHISDSAIDALHLPYARLIWHSLMLALLAACMVMAVGFALIAFSRLGQGRGAKLLSGISILGYAFPGTILAIGVLFISGMLDSIFEFLSVELFLTGSLAMLLFGLLVRFLAVGFGSLATAIEKMPPFMLESGQILGHNFTSILRQVFLPQLKYPLLVGGMLVFVDVMKELPLTLLLRPFAFETFATISYEYAKEEMIEVAALPALFIILIGIVPVFIANHVLAANTGRPS